MPEIIRAKGKVRSRMILARQAEARELKSLAFRPAFEHPEAKHARAEALRRALHIAAADVAHIEKLDFIPSHFVLQWHGWGDKEFLASLGARGTGKSHFDLRIQKLTAPSWFGLTLFSDPTKAPTKGLRHLGTVKGYERLVWGSRKEPQEHGEKVKEREGEISPLRGGHAVPQVRKRGLEGMGEMKWMSYEGMVRPGGPGNPTRNLWSRMKIVDRGPAVLHRRELDFVDVTLIGKKLRGRHFHRLVKGPTKEEKEAGRESELGKAVRYYFWRWTKEPESWLREMLPVAIKKRTLPTKVIGRGT